MGGPSHGSGRDGTGGWSGTPTHAGHLKTAYTRPAHKAWHRHNTEGVRFGSLGEALTQVKWIADRLVQRHEPCASPWRIIAPQSGALQVLCAAQIRRPGGPS